MEVLRLVKTKGTGGWERIERGLGMEMSVVEFKKFTRQDTGGVGIWE
jgi:hypothetical protein